MKLNLGCGPNVFAGWHNMDREDINKTFLSHMRSAQSFEGWPTWQRELGEALHRGDYFNIKQGDIMSVTEWPRPSYEPYNPYADAIYLGQVVEHLNPLHQLPRLLQNCYEKLKPGGVLRITTPCFDKILDAFGHFRMGDFAAEQPAFYASAPPTKQLSYLLFGATGPDSVWDHYEGHMHVWTPDTLTELLREAGFTGEVSQDWPSRRLPDVRDFGKSHSFALEVVKP